MDRSKTDQAVQTFAKRAPDYDSETSWVTDLELIKPLVPFREDFADTSSGRFLDTCAGTGRVASLAKSRGWNVVAVDQSKEMLGSVDTNAILAVQVDANSLPFFENSFDVCAMRQALHYFDPESMIRQLMKIARSEIRLGHITTHHEDDVELWSEYFETASPARKHVFIPGQIGDTIKRVGAQLVDESVFYSTERFDGPVEHLGSTVVDDLRKNFLRGDPTVVERYVNNQSDNSEIVMKLRWEFHVVRFPEN